MWCGTLICAAVMFLLCWCRFMLWCVVLCCDVLCCPEYLMCCCHVMLWCIVLRSSGPHTRSSLTLVCAWCMCMCMVHSMLCVCLWCVVCVFWICMMHVHIVVEYTTVVCYYRFNAAVLLNTREGCIPIIYCILNEVKIQYVFIFIYESAPVKIHW